MKPAIQPKETTTMKKQLWILVMAVAIMFTIAHAQAAIINDTAFNGTYTSNTDANLAFTPDTGKIYGISAAMDILKFTWVANGQTGNMSFLGIIGPTYSVGQSWYADRGSVGRWVNTVRGSGGTPFLGNITGPFYTGVSLDTTGPTWTVNYYYGGTGFDANSVYQGGTAFGAATGIAPSSITQIIFSYRPYDAATSGQNREVVSDFKLTVDPVPEPASLALLGLSSVLLLRRRRR